MSATDIKRLQIDLTEDAHRELRILAAQEGVPMSSILKAGLIKELESRGAIAAANSMKEAAQNGNG